MEWEAAGGRTAAHQRGNGKKRLRQQQENKDRMAQKEEYVQ